METVRISIKIKVINHLEDVCGVPWKSSVLVVNRGFWTENSSKLKIFVSLHPVLRVPENRRIKRKRSTRGRRIKRCIEWSISHKTKK